MKFFEQLLIASADEHVLNGFVHLGFGAERMHVDEARAVRVHVRFGGVKLAVENFVLVVVVELLDPVARVLAHAVPFHF